MNTRDQEIYEKHLTDAIKTVRQSDSLDNILKTVFGKYVNLNAGSNAISVGMNNLYNLQTPIISAWHRPSNNSPCSFCSSANSSDVLLRSTYQGDIGHIDEVTLFNEVVKPMIRERLNGVVFSSNVVSVPHVKELSLVSRLDDIAILTKPIGFRRPKNLSLRNHNEVDNYSTSSLLKKKGKKYFYSEVGKFVSSCADKSISSSKGDALVITTTGTVFHISVVTRDDFFSKTEKVYIAKKLGIKIVNDDFDKITGLYKYVDIPFFSFKADINNPEMFELMLSLMVAFDTRSTDWFTFLDLYKQEVIKNF